MDNEKIKHLEFIQNIITRMNTNSFQIKTFTITIVAALLALFASNQEEWLVFISIIMVLLFWSLDSYYLQQERKFREIYNNVSGLKNNIDVRNFEMPINNKKLSQGQFKFWKVFFSKTILTFYISIVTLLIMIILYINF